MTILMLMIPLALILGASFLGAFVWAARSGQFDDSVTPAFRILENDKDQDKQE